VRWLKEAAPTLLWMREKANRFRESHGCGNFKASTNIDKEDGTGCSPQFLAAYFQIQMLQI
jgi:hypothetical protein